MPQVFQRFYRSARVSGVPGHGLALYICQGIYRRSWRPPLGRIARRRAWGHVPLYAAGNVMLPMSARKRRSSFRLPPESPAAWQLTLVKGKALVRTLLSTWQLRPPRMELLRCAREI